MFGIDDAAAATLATGALGFIGGQLTNSANAARADASNQWSADQFATRYQTTVKDLEAAGLNPMLAYSQGGGSPPTAQQVQFQNPVSSAMDAVRSTSGAVQSFASANQANAMVDQINATTEKIGEEIKNIPFEGERLKRAAEMLYQQGNLLFAEQGTAYQKAEFYKQSTENLKKDGILKGLDIEAAQSLNNLGRTSKELEPVIKVFMRLLSK